VTTPSEDGEQIAGLMAPAAEAHRPARVIIIRPGLPSRLPGVEMGLESQRTALATRSDSRSIVSRPTRALAAVPK